LNWNYITQLKGAPLARSNFSYDKRMKELAKKKKKEEKLQRKRDKGKTQAEPEENEGTLPEAEDAETP